RQDEERRGQRARDAPHGHRRLLHALQQRRLRLGRRPVDLVGQHDVGEERTLLELEVLPTVGVLDDDVGPDDVGGHQVGGELDARERQLETLRQRLDEEPLAEARHALEQHVAAREHADEDVVDDLAVTDDDLLDLRAQRLERGDEFPNPAVVGHRVSSLWMTSPGATTPRAHFHYNMQETRHTSTLETRPQARAGTITGWPGSAAAWRAVPIHGAGVLTTACRCGIETASGIDGDGPLPRACPRFASVSSAYWNQSAIDLPVAVDLARGRVALGHARASGRAEPRAQRGVARQAQGRRLQLGVAGEHQPGDLVLDERAVARNVRGEHRATERLRLEL